jgi:hypothetical protein
MVKALNFKNRDWLFSFESLVYRLVADSVVCAPGVVGCFNSVGSRPCSAVAVPCADESESLT